MNAYIELWLCDRCGLAYHCGIGLFSKLYWEQLITHVENLKQLDRSLKCTVHKKINARSFKDSNVKCKTLKLLEEINKTLSELCVGEGIF